jgi:hypothetical protein
MLWKRMLRCIMVGVSCAHILVDFWMRDEANVNSGCEG